MLHASFACDFDGDPSHLGEKRLAHASVLNQGAQQIGWGDCLIRQAVSPLTRRIPASLARAAWHTSCRPFPSFPDSPGSGKITYIYSYQALGCSNCMLRLFSSRFSFSLGTNLCLYRSSYRSSYSYSYSTLNKTAGKMAFLGGHEKKHKVTIVGSGNWYEENPMLSIHMTTSHSVV